MKRFLYIIWVWLAVCVPVLSIAQPVANFSSSVTSGCAPLIVQFTDLSTGSPTSWSWTFTGPNDTITASAQNPAVNFTVPGNYTVKLVATNALGSNAKTSVAYLHVVVPPTIQFTTPDTLGCAPLFAHFTNTSTTTGSGRYYTWYFGDGDTTQQHKKNPVHKYSGPGIYSVTLFEFDTVGCSANYTHTDYIVVNDTPSASFTATNTIACHAPDTVVFNNTSTGAATYLWKFGDGSAPSAAFNPTHIYTAPGNYTDTLIVTNNFGCKDTLRYGNFVAINNIYAAFSYASPICLYADDVFQSTSPFTGPTLMQWSFGDGSPVSNSNPSATHAYSSPGVYAVKLRFYGASCLDSVTHNVTVDAPAISFNATDTYSCAVPFTVSYISGITGASPYTYSWFFGDGGTSGAPNPTHTYTTPGYFTDTLAVTDVHGCKDTLVKSNYIFAAAPLAIITTPDSVCLGSVFDYSVSVTNTLSYTIVSINFGDATPNVTDSVGTHTYTSVGLHTVTFTYNTGLGCTLSVTKNVYTGNIYPVASPTELYTTLCPNTADSFYANCANCSVYFWNFGILGGAGSSDSLANPFFGYHNPGAVHPYVLLYSGGCMDSIALPAVTVTQPSNNFQFNLINCSDRLTYSFTAVSPGFTYVWDFGDGSPPVTTTTQMVQHTFPGYGVYPITYNVYQVGGCSNSKVLNFNIYPIVTNFHATDTTICKDGYTKFIASGIPGGTGVYSLYAWDFGNGLDTGAVVTDTFHTAGYYTVKLIVADGFGCKDSIIKSNYIQVGGPIAGFNFTFGTGCAPFPVTFQDQSTFVPGIPIVSRNWIFGDGHTNTGNNATVTNPYDVGTYSVILIDTDAAGCASSDTMANIISVTQPHAYFTAPDTFACPLLPIPFTDTNTNVIYSWRFGDGGTSTIHDPIHAYTAAGTFNDTLIVTNTFGCSDTMIRNAYVHINPLSVGFILSDTTASCPPLFVNMTNNSAPSLNGPLSYAWDFGNGSTSVVTNPSAFYNSVNTFTVTLVATDAVGCTDSAKHQVHVHGPSGVLTYTPVSGCAPMLVHFVVHNPQSMAGGLYYWGPDASAATTADTNFNYTYTVPGTYVPEVILSNAGCQVTMIATDTIRVDHVDADFSFVPNPVCSSGVIQFTDTVTSALSAISTISWDFGDPASGALNTSAAHNPTHLYSVVDSYTVKFITTNVQGCSDTVIKVVHIYPAPRIRVDSNQATCLGQAPAHLLVTDSAGVATTYTWLPANSGLTSYTAAAVNALPTATTTYTVVAHTVHGCTDTGNVTVTINSISVTGNFPLDICTGDSILVAGYGAGLGGTYLWTPAATVTCSTCDSTMASPPGTTTYIVRGTAANGCYDTAHVTVTIHQPPNINLFGNQITVCNGDSVRLVGAGAGTGGYYTWAPAATVSCITCDTTFATPAATTTYTVVGHTAGISCSDSANYTVIVPQGTLLTLTGRTDVCTGTDTVALSVSGANHYTWHPVAAVSCDTCANIIAHLDIATTYIVKGSVNDNNVCPGIDTISIIIDPAPVVTAPDQVLCNGDSVQLLATGAATYTWFPTTGLSCTNCPSPYTHVDSAIVYTIAGVDIHGCKDTGTVSVTVNYTSPVAISKGDTICPGHYAQLQVTGGTQYIWEPSSSLDNNTLANPVATPTVTTIYTVTVLQGNCFADSEYVTVTVGNPPVISLPPNMILGSGDSILLAPDTVITGATYLWSPASGLSCIECPNPIAHPYATITYSLTVTTPEGCVSGDSITITVKCDGTQVFIPNTFTPNNDGINDRFYPSGKGLYAISSFRIFDRWGEKVFEAQNIPPNNPEYGWDGRYKGRLLDPDVYVYEIHARCESGDPFYFKGDISLVR